MTNNYCLTGHALTRTIAVTVSSSTAGMVAGIAYAPILATRMVLGKLARPAALAGAGFALAKGAARLVQLRGVGPAQLLRRLACGSAELGVQLEVLLKVAVRAARSEGFRKAFIRCGVCVRGGGRLGRGCRGEGGVGCACTPQAASRTNQQSTRTDRTKRMLHRPGWAAWMRSSSCCPTWARRATR